MVGLILLASSSLSPAVPEPEHTIWLTVESVPSEAALYAIGADGHPGKERIGTTPCTLAVDLNWGSRWFRKKWELITVWSPGGFCRPVLQSDGRYELRAHLLAAKGNRSSLKVDEVIAVLEPPGPDWSGRANWPVRRVLTLQLAQETDAADRISVAEAAPRRVLSVGKDAARGTGCIRVTSDKPNAQVTVNGEPFGPVPVDLFLVPGQHIVEVRVPGHAPVRRGVDLEPDRTVTVQALFLR